MTRTVHFEEIPVPHLLAAADGRPSIPSDPDAGAKSGGIPVLSSDGAAELADMAHREGSHAVTLSPSSEPTPLPAETKAADAATPPASAATHSQSAGLVEAAI